MTEVLERLRDAQNHHDLDAFVACFDPQYRSEQPVHPDRAFVGRQQVRSNWAEVFAGVPDFQAELLRSAEQDDTGWAEWHWHGTRTDGTRLDMRGVTIFGVRDNRISWGRLYLEDVEGGQGIDRARRPNVQLSRHLITMPFERNRNILGPGRVMEPMARRLPVATPAWFGQAWLAASAAARAREARRIAKEELRTITIAA